MPILTRGRKHSLWELGLKYRIILLFRPISVRPCHPEAEGKEENAPIWKPKAEKNLRLEEPKVTFFRKLFSLASTPLFWQVFLLSIKPATFCLVPPCYWNFKTFKLKNWKTKTILSLVHGLCKVSRSQTWFNNLVSGQCSLFPCGRTIPEPQTISTGSLPDN